MSSDNEEDETTNVCAVNHVDTEKVSFVFDTGSAVTVVTPDCGTQYPLRKGDGNTYKSASKHKINMKEARHLETSDNRILRSQVGEVSRSLLAAHDLLATGHQVVLDDDPEIGCYAVHKKTGKRIEIKHQGKGFLVDFEIKQKPPLNGVGRR